MFIKLNTFPFIGQYDSSDCGIACLRMVSKYYGVNLSSAHSLFSNENITRQGITLHNLGKLAEQVGYKPVFVKLSYEQMTENVVLPAVFFWNQNHYVIVYKITKNKIYVADPVIGKLAYKKNEFIKGWIGNSDKGLILLLQPTSKLIDIVKDGDSSIKKKIDLKYVLNYLFQYKKSLIFVGITLFLSSTIELIFPFFTQKIIDQGVQFKNISLLYVLLFGQIALFVSKIANEYYRSWLFIHISSRVSLSIISDFLKKLMDLPIRFFDSKNIGDLMQRIDDHKRVESFLSTDLLQTVFSTFMILVYISVLVMFNSQIAFIFLIGTIFKLWWILGFLKKIAILDKKQFSLLSKDQNKIFELIRGMQEIKLNNLESQKRWQWEKIQTKIFTHNIEKLQLDQKYKGYRFVNFIINILIIFYAALKVIEGEITIGSMMAIIFVLGGLHAPVSQLINFILQFKLVKVSFERMTEIHQQEDEENGLCNTEKIVNTSSKNIVFNDVQFSYGNSFSLNNVNLTIPGGKTTAIVGVSGSGKTTILKLLLKFYSASKGKISIDDVNFKNLDSKDWRSHCGAILQDSFIFSETISYNITLDKEFDEEKLSKVVELSNIKGFIEGLPLKYNTIIGDDGVQISHGQKQRLLIARILYKNPDIILFDEATNSLDAENERLIVNNIDQYFKGKTMIVVAHRLSTVINADQIIVVENGQIIEEGKHDELIYRKGKYFKLIKNQLELGN